MQTAERQEELSGPDNTPGPGTRLREAREAAGLSIQQVAAQLHLHARTIAALEADDFDNLPAAIYVRGYLRNYAKLVAMDGDALVADYDDTGDHEPHLTPPLKPPSQARSSDRPVKAVTYLLSLCLVLLLLAWWQSRNLGHDDLASALLESEPSATVAEIAVAEPEPVVMPGPDYRFPVIRHPDTPPRPAAPRITSGATEAVTPASAPPATSDPTATARTTDPVAPILPEPVPPETGTVETNTGGLVLTMSAESWIEVRDATGTRIYTGLGRSGQTLELRGQLPLQVVIGYAPGVEVHYRGEPFDLAPHSSAGVARFTIDD